MKQAGFYVSPSMQLGLKGHHIWNEIIFLLECI